jgi:hypothetical protein
MRREIVLLAAALLAVSVVVAVAVSGPEQFTERKAEATVERALKRCETEGDIGPIRCRDVGNGFACRAGGELIATFDEPDPEQPQFEVMC